MAGLLDEVLECREAKDPHAFLLDVAKKMPISMATI
jgi:hypothetical protein